MTDKRILKTKRTLKQSLSDLMIHQPYQKITVKEVCDNAMVSRITFYTYYDGKEDLLDAVADDLQDEMAEQYRTLQKQNNPQDEITLRYQNILDAIQDTEERHADFFKAAQSQGDLRLITSYYNRMITVLTENLEETKSRMQLKYPAEKIAAWIVFGCWGYLHGKDFTHTSRTRDRQELHQIIASLFAENIFFRER